jgi:alpha-1,3-rhamnosyl/mannosyltransferase
LVRGGFVVAVGNVSTRKNLVTVVRAVAAADPGLVLVLAGRPHSGSAVVEAEIERLGLGDRVRRLGFVADDELPVLLQAARGLVHPSVDEGFGFPPLEAMAAGVPVVASGAGSIPEIVGEAGVLLDPADVDGWAGALARLVVDDDWRAELVERGRRRAEGFTWSRTATETLAVYERAVA